MKEELVTLMREVSPSMFKWLLTTCNYRQAIDEVGVMHSFTEIHWDDSCPAVGVDAFLRSFDPQGSAHFFLAGPVELEVSNEVEQRGEWRDHPWAPISFTVHTRLSWKKV